MIEAIKRMNKQPEKFNEKATNLIDNLTEEIIIEIEKLRSGEETSEALNAKANELLSLLN